MEVALCMASTVQQPWTSGRVPLSSSGGQLPLSNFRGFEEDEFGMLDNDHILMLLQ